jgi:PGF-pre-PGF domain-containing protein
MKRGKELLIIFFVSLVILTFLGVLIADNSESASEWWMFGKFLTHNAWDANNFTVISGMNTSSFLTGGFSVLSSPSVINGNVYVGTSDGSVYQLNATNISQQIANYTVFISGAPVLFSQSPAVVNGFVYVGGQSDKLHQLNATNIAVNYANSTIATYISSSIIASIGGVGTFAYYGDGAGGVQQVNASNVSQRVGSFQTLGGSISSAPAFAYGNIYIPGTSTDNRFFQLNATNLSFGSIANYSFPGGWPSGSSPVVWGFYVYIATASNISNPGVVYQLNATNVTQQIANFTFGTGAGGSSKSPAIATIGTSASNNTYLYITGVANGVVSLYQLNATNISRIVSNYSSFSAGVQSPVIATVAGNPYVYLGSNDFYMYQFNASNVSKLIGKIYTGATINNVPAYANGYLYFGSSSFIYQVNATNLSLFTLIDQTSPIVNINFPQPGVTYSGTAPVSINMNEQGTCFYSTNGGGANRSLVTADNVFFAGDTDVLSDGTYVLNAYCNDTAGNRNDTANMTFVMNSATGAVVYGGGGSYIPPNQITQTSSWTQITPGQPVVMQVTNPSVSITNITIRTTTNVSSVSLSLQQNLANSTVINFKISTSSTGVVYQAFDITGTNLNSSNMANATITFRVNKTWITQNGANPTRMRLYRKPSGSTTWSRITTTQTGQDADYYYYSATTPGFSTFLVFFDLSGEGCNPGDTRCLNKNVQFCLGNSTWLVTEQCQHECSNAQCVQTFLGINMSIVYYGVIIAVGSAIIVVVFFMFRRFTKKKKKKK